MHLIGQHLKQSPRQLFHRRIIEWLVCYWLAYSHLHSSPLNLLMIILLLQFTYFKVEIFFSLLSSTTAMACCLTFALVRQNIHHPTHEPKLFTNEMWMLHHWSWHYIAFVLVFIHFTIIESWFFGYMVYDFIGFYGVFCVVLFLYDGFRRSKIVR